MKKLIAFLIFLLAAMQGATSQEVLGQQIPLPLADDYKNTEFPSSRAFLLGHSNDEGVIFFRTSCHA